MLFFCNLIIYLEQIYEVVFFAELGYAKSSPHLCTHKGDVLG